MLISDIQANVKNKIGLSSAESPFILTYLTKGYRLLLQSTRFYVTTTTIVITAGTDEYQLAVTLDEILDLTVAGSLIKPDFVTREEILDLRRYANSGTTQGDTYAYNIEGNLLMIYPTPTSSATWTVYGLTEPTSSDFTGTENLVSDLHCVPLGPIAEALEYYGLWQTSEYDDKSLAENSTTYRQWWLDAVQDVRKAVRKRGHRSLPTARIGYPAKRAFPQRNDTYPSISRTES